MATTLKRAGEADRNTPRLKALHVGTPAGPAGLLVKESQHVFSCAPEAIVNNDQRRAISLTMPVTADSYRSFPIFPVFQTSLPEGFLKERIVQRFSKTLRVDDMALLALAGGSRIGRLRLSISEDAPADDLGVESLKEILQSNSSQDLFEALCDKYLIASAGIAGVQPKVVLEAHDDLGSSAIGDERESTPQAKTSIGEKSTLRGKRLIVKAAGAEYPGLAENEFHCLSIARRALLPVPEFWLSEDRQRLAIRRFDIDEESGAALGFEDMVSLQGKVNEHKYEGSYETVARAIERNASPVCLVASLRDFFESVVLSVILRNGDAHLKNFGLLYTDPTSDDCRLAPLYDVICTTVFLPQDQMALKLAKTKSWPNRRALVEFGRCHCYVDDAVQRIERVCDAASEYRPDREETEMWARMHAQIAIGVGAVGV